MKTTRLIGNVELSDAVFLSDSIQVEFTLGNKTVYDLTVPVLKHIRDFITFHYRSAEDFGPIDENIHFDSLTHRIEVSINIPSKKVTAVYMIDAICKFDENNTLVDIDLSRYEGGINSFYIL